MAILSDFGTHSEHEVVRHILQRLDFLTQGNESVFRDYVLMLEILSQNRDLEQVIKEEQNMLSQVKYSDSPSFHLGMEKGMEQGLEKGLEKGEAKLFLRMVESSFGALSAHFLTQVNSANSEQLEVWSLRLFTAISLEELFSSKKQSSTGAE